MAFYSVKMGLTGDLSQQEAMDLLRNAGAEVIQTSDGLCVKTQGSVTEIQKSNARLSKLNFQEVSTESKEGSLSEDVKTFMNI